MKFYIGAPMTDIPDHNFPAIDAARDFLLRGGHEVVSPADMDRDAGYDALADDCESFTDDQYEEAMRRAYKAIDGVDAIALLPGWLESKGVRRELQHAVKREKNMWYYLLLMDRKVNELTLVHEAYIKQRLADMEQAPLFTGGGGS